MKLMGYARLLFTCGAIATTGLNVAVGAEQCTESRLPIVLRLATATTAAPIPVAAFLVGNLTPGLRIVDAASGRLLWTAGAAGAYTQRFAGMSAGFTSSLAVLDTDGDGTHDRIYAGDLQGRLWRLDIDTRGPATSWVAGGIFADLSGVPGRGFIAAPDLALISPTGMRPWLSIALGTANTAGMNRFYVLRDRAPFTGWTQSQYDRWRPLVEADLLLAEGTRLDVSQAGNGFYINLGSRQVAASALTLDGTTYYTTVSTGASLLPSCSAPAPVAATVDVGSISAVSGSLDAQHISAGDIRAVPATSAITLVRDQGTGGFNCEVAGNTLPGCSIDSTLRRSFWRREDAD